MDDVPQELIDDIKKKKTYQVIAQGRARRLGIPYEQLPDAEWQAIWLARSRSRKKYHAKAAKRKVLADQPLPPVFVDQPTVLQDYLSYYTDPAPNDLVTLRNLVEVQRQLDTVSGLIQDIFNQEPLDTRRYSDLSKIQKELSTELRLLQETLGISRRQRDQNKQSEEFSDRVFENIRQAKVLMDDLGIKLFCPHCQARGKTILNGFVIHHFPEMGIKITTRCPMCQVEYTVERSPRKWERLLDAS